MMKRCRVCGATLAVTANWFPSAAHKNDYICKSCTSKKDRAYYRANRTKKLTYQRRYRLANPEQWQRWLAAHPDYYRRQYWADPERAREKQRRWAKANPEKRLAKERKARTDYPERYRAYDLRRLRFRGRNVRMSTNPRSGICADCGKTRGSRQHHLHHERYDPKNPLAHTVELCPACHKKHHAKKQHA